MKKSILFLILAAAMVLMLSSCSAESDDETCTIEKRIKSFFDDINNDKSVAYENLHPGCTMRNQLKSVTAWDPYFLGSDYTCNGSKSGSVWEGTFSGVGYTDNTSIGFQMKEDGTDNWKILSISIDNGRLEIH